MDAPTTITAARVRGVPVEFIVGMGMLCEGFVREMYRPLLMGIGPLWQGLSTGAQGNSAHCAGDCNLFRPFQREHESSAMAPLGGSWHFLKVICNVCF